MTYNWKTQKFWFATGKNSELCWHKLERNNWKTKNLYCAHDTWHIRFEHWVYEHGHDIEIQTRKNTNTEKYKHKIKNTNTDVLNCKIFRVKLWKYLSGIAKLQKVLQKVLQNCKKYCKKYSKKYCKKYCKIAKSISLEFQNWWSWSWY